MFDIFDGITNFEKFLACFGTLFAISPLIGLLCEAYQDAIRKKFQEAVHALYGLSDDCRTYASIAVHRCSGFLAGLFK